MQLVAFQKWISPDLVILYITFIPCYWDYLDQLSSAVNPLTTRSGTALYWVGGILPLGLSSIWIIIGLSQTFTGLSPDYGIITGLKDNPGLSYFFLIWAVQDFFYNFQLCGGYSLLSDWLASVGKSLLIVPLLTYTIQVSEYLGHTSLNPDKINSLASELVYFQHFPPVRCFAGWVTGRRTALHRCLCPLLNTAFPH